MPGRQNAGTDEAHRVAGKRRVERAGLARGRDGLGVQQQNDDCACRCYTNRPAIR
jgi:hypothetical protein